MAATRREAEALRQLAERLPDVERPSVVEGTPDQVAAALSKMADLRFDAAQRDQIVAKLEEWCGDPPEPEDEEGEVW